MKKFLIITSIIFSCTKSEIKPKCYLIQWEKVITYNRSLEVWSDEPELPKVTKGQEIKCNITAQQLAEILKAGNTTTKGIGICITIHTIASETQETQEKTPELTITILSNSVYDLTFSRDGLFYWAETWDQEQIKELRLKNFDIGTYKLTITGKNKTIDTVFNYPKVTNLTIEMP